MSCVSSGQQMLPSSLRMRSYRGVESPVVAPRVSRATLSLNPFPLGCLPTEPSIQCFPRPSTSYRGSTRAGRSTTRCRGRGHGAFPADGARGSTVRTPRPPPRTYPLRRSWRRACIPSKSRRRSVTARWRGRFQAPRLLPRCRGRPPRRALSSSRCPTSPAPRYRARRPRSGARSSGGSREYQGTCGKCCWAARPRPGAPTT